MFQIVQILGRQTLRHFQQHLAKLEPLFAVIYIGSHIGWVWQAGGAQDVNKQNGVQVASDFVSHFLLFVQ